MFVDWKKSSRLCWQIKKNQNGYVSCSAVCPFKSVKNIFFVKLFDFWVILSGEFSIDIIVSQAYLPLIYIAFLTHMFVK